MPDLIIWMMSEKTRVAYARIPVREILYSENTLESGIYNGKIQTVFFRVFTVCSKILRHILALNISETITDIETLKKLNQKPYKKLNVISFKTAQLSFYYHS